MNPHRKIPPRLWPVVGRMRRDGRAAHEIADVLERDHGVTVTSRSVNRLLVHLAEEDRAVAVRALQGVLLDHVPGLLASVRKSARHVGALVLQADDVAEAAAGLRAQADLLERVAKLGGVAVAQAVDVTTAGKPVSITLAWPDGDPAPPAPSEPA